MRELNVEKYFVRQVKRRMPGARVYKLTCRGKTGMHDRMVLFDGHTFFVEVKKPNEKPRATQYRRFKEVRDTGNFTAWVNDKRSVDRTITRMQTWALL